MVCGVQRIGEKILFPGKLTKTTIMNFPGGDGKSKAQTQKH